MKAHAVLMLAFLLGSCSENPVQPTQIPSSQIVAYVHSGNQGLAGRQIALLQTGDTLRTDGSGVARFFVPPGRYVIRAFDINGPGPALRTLDIEVETHAGAVTKVDIFDCLECV